MFERECWQCRRILPETEFYSFKGGIKDSWCKECRLQGCNDLQPWTFFNLMRMYDIPFIEEQWWILVKRQILKTVKDKLTYTTIFGKYLAKMKLKGFIDWHFDDSINLNAKWGNETTFINRDFFLPDDINNYIKMITVQYQEKK